MLLSYKIASCSTEDGDHPVREIKEFNSQSRGWQSERWSDFPQALVLRFPGRVNLQQLQVLSHHYKIATRIEMFIGDMPPGILPPATGAEGVEYMRLGHFSLGSNEHSGFQARELKTVYVPRSSEGCFLKLLLHKCHLNENNLYNQVGLLAVRPIGTGPGAVSAPIHVAPDRHIDTSHLAAARAPADPPPLAAQLRAAESTPRELPAHESHGAAMDPSVVASVREIEDRKREAVEAEDFDKAKQLKARIDALKQVGSELAAIEQKKASAIEVEDYDLAKAYKTQINDLRGKNGLPGFVAADAAAAHRSSLMKGGAGSLGGPADELRDAQELEMVAAQKRINMMAQQMGGPAPV